MTFPSDDQRGYLGSAIDDNVYLEACPGSGKTEVIAAKENQKSHQHRNERSTVNRKSERTPNGIDGRNALCGDAWEP